MAGDKLEPWTEGPQSTKAKLNGMTSKINDLDTEVSELQSGEPESIIILKNGIAYYADIPNILITSLIGPEDET
jgi:hypothetical protein